MVIAALGLALIALLAVFVAIGQETDIKRKEAVISWCDEREVMLVPLLREVEILRAVGAIPTRNYATAIDGVWKTGRFGPNGPRTFVPSTEGIRQIEMAMEILRDRDAASAEIRRNIIEVYGRVATWEKRNPVPDYGIPPMVEPAKTVLRALSE